jgi:integrase
MLLILTGLRSQEIAGLRWNEVLIDEKGEFGPRLRISAERMKDKKEHTVPLSPLAVEILRKTKLRSDKTGPIFRNYHGRVPERGLDLNHVRNEINARIEKMQLTALPHWTLHDLRRTMRTALSEKIGVDNEVAAQLLAHSTGNSVDAGVYNKANLWNWKRQAVERWEDELRSIVYGTPKKVVSLKGRISVGPQAA